MSERDAGICPLCEQRGEIGAACGHNAICQKRELHFIPLEYFDRLRDTKPNDRPAYIGETIDDYLLVGLLGEVFPTGVGMNRRLPPCARRAVGVPHGRGDEPCSSSCRAQSLWCSPRAWG